MWHFLPLLLLLREQRPFQAPGLHRTALQGILSYCCLMLAVRDNPYYQVNWYSCRKDKPLGTKTFLELEEADSWLTRLAPLPPTYVGQMGLCFSARRTDCPWTLKLNEIERDQLSLIRFLTAYKLKLHQLFRLKCKDLPRSSADL